MCAIMTTMKKKYHVQHYRTEWESNKAYKNWLKPMQDDRTRAFCNYCHATMNAKLTDIKNHLITKRHQLHELMRKVKRKNTHTAAAMQVAENKLCKQCFHCTQTDKDTTKDTTKDTSKDTSKDTTKDSIKDTAKDTTKDTIKDASKDTNPDIDATFLLGLLPEVHAMDFHQKLTFKRRIYEVLGEVFHTNGTPTTSKIDLKGETASNNKHYATGTTVNSSNKRPAMRQIITANGCATTFVRRKIMKTRRIVKRKAMLAAIQHNNKRRKLNSTDDNANNWQLTNDCDSDSYTETPPNDEGHVNGDVGMPLADTQQSTGDCAVKIELVCEIEPELDALFMNDGVDCVKQEQVDEIDA